MKKIHIYILITIWVQTYSLVLTAFIVCKDNTCATLFVIKSTAFCRNFDTSLLRVLQTILSRAKYEKIYLFHLSKQIIA